LNCKKRMRAQHDDATTFGGEALAAFSSAFLHELHEPSSPAHQHELLPGEVWCHTCLVPRPTGRGWPPAQQLPDGFWGGLEWERL
jgi:hypothetical protein